jgi:HEAT repeat protein
VLSRVLKVQPGEGRTVALVVALMFVSVAGLTMGESGIGALFFDRVGADALPVLYLGQGVVGLAGMLLLSGALGRFDQRRAYVALPLGLALLVAVERIVAAGDPTWVYWVLWLTTTIAYLVQAVYLWGTAGVVTDTRRAKRLFPLFGAGSILGAVVGGLATRPVAAAIGAANLLVVWVVALVGTSALCAVALGVRRRDRRPPARSRRPSAVGEIRRGFAFVRRSPLLVWVSAAAILFSVLYYSLFLPYAQAAAERFPDPEDLAGFFGIFWAAVTTAAFVVSVLLANRLLAWFGAAAMIVILPVLYAGSFGLLLATSTFATLVAIRFGVSVWMQGVASPAWETLINVTPEHRRDQTRAFLNGGPSQMGTAIAGVVQLVGQDVLSPRQLSMIGLAAALLTIAAAWRIRRSYTTALVAAIRAGRPRVFDDAVPNLAVALRPDAQATALAIAALDDEDPRMRRLGAELLADADDDRSTEALLRALGDGDAIVRANAIRALALGDRLGRPELDAALGDEDPEVRHAAVVAIDPESVPLALLRDGDAAVAAASAVALLGGDARPDAEPVLDRLLSDADAEVRRVALEALERAGPDDVAAFASPRAHDDAPAVRAAALRTLAEAPPAIGVPAALEGLSSPVSVVRRAALDALDRADLAQRGGDIDRIVRGSSEAAARDGDLAAAIPSDGDAAELLRWALLERARARAVVALSALSITSGDREAMRVALDVLEQGANAQVANALETIETAANAGAARPLLALWETRPAGAPLGRSTWLDSAAEHEDPFVRSCAELVRRDRDEGDAVARSSGSMSAMELVLVLRRIPLFAELAPADLQRVAAIAEERAYAGGDVIGAEGELGDEMHVVLDGVVRVARGDGRTIATRSAGDVVGEMSLITRSPRVASLVAEGDVRTLRIEQLEFEAMVRERPEIALAVLRVLAERLGAMTSGSADSSA